MGRRKSSEDSAVAASLAFALDRHCVIKLLLFTRPTCRGDVHIDLLSLHVTADLRLVRLLFLLVIGGAGASRAAEVHVRCPLLPQHLLVHVIVIARLAPLVVFFVEQGHEAANCLVRCVVGAWF